VACDKEPLYPERLHQGDLIERMDGTVTGAWRAGRQPGLPEAAQRRHDRPKTRLPKQRADRVPCRSVIRPAVQQKDDRALTLIVISDGKVGKVDPRHPTATVDSQPSSRAKMF